MPVRRQTIPAALFLVIAVPAMVAAMECNVCHSKNPAMVRMHTATRFKEIGCFDCHKIGEKLMGKGQPKDRESLLKRRVTDACCKNCHLKPVT